METKPERHAAVHVVDAIRRAWWLILAVSLPFFLAVVYVAETLPNEYEAETVVAFVPKPDAQIGSDMLRLTLPRYPVFATSDETLQALSDRTGIPIEKVRDHVVAKLATETANLTVTVTAGDPETASTLANALALDIVTYAKTDTIANAAVVARDTASPLPVGPPRRLIEAAGLFVALLLGVGAALVLTWLSPRISSVEDVAELVHVPLMGRIPVSREAKRGALAAVDSDPALASAVRALRTSLLVHMPPEPGVAVLVTSTLSREGKSSVAAWLAQSLAGVRSSVLLIDGDLVKPSVADVMGVPAEPGIGSVLSGHAALVDAVKQPGVPHLDVLTARPDPFAGDNLTVGMFKLLEEARKSYSIIVVDGPPVLGSDTGQTLASQVDHCLFVTSIGSPTKKVGAALDLLDLVEAHVAGILVNRVPRRSSSAYTSYDAT